MMKSILALISISFLISCTTLSRDECQTMNWHERGMTDAKSGKTADVFNDYHKACRKYGISTNQAEYAKGRTKGLNQFCTYESGLNFGIEGEEYKDTCPEGRKNEFLRGYNHGTRELKIKEKERDLERREQDLDDREAQLKRREAEIP